MSTAIAEDLYYRVDAIMTRNAVFNFIIGGRGIGKTFSFKEYGVRDYIKRGNQFIYLRRYKTELSTRQTYFADFAFKFPEYGFRVNGFEAQMTRNPDVEKPHWETMGYFISLATSQQKKSVAYPRVRTIIFDEFIIEKGVVQYIKDEARVMLDFYSTVDRYRGNTRVFFLANSVSIMNPYFLEYDIDPRDGDKWIRKEDGFICVHIPDDAEFANAALGTRFGKFIANTDYAKYSVGNEFRDNGTELLGAKPSHAYYWITLETKSGTFSIWRDDFDERGLVFYIQEKRPKVESMFTLEADRMDGDKTLLEYSDKITQYLRTAFKRGRVGFDKPKTKNAFIQIFKR